MGAWYQVQLDQFLEVSVDSIIGDLARLAGDRNLPTNRETQQSWRNTVEELRKSSKVWCDEVPNAFGWTLLLEYEVPRRSRRIDAVLIIDPPPCFSICGITNRHAAKGPKRLRAIAASNSSKGMLRR